MTVAYKSDPPEKISILSPLAILVEVPTDTVESVALFVVVSELFP